MNEATGTKQEERWATHWYAVAQASALGRSSPLGLQRLGRRLVLWRDADGVAHGADAACPHRGADLGLGRVREGMLECPYHGFRYDGGGACRAMPCEGREAKPSKALSLRKHPVREAHGFIWAWLGGVTREPLPELPWLPSAPEPGPNSASVDDVWSARFTRVMEGMLDLHHFPFAHRRYVPPGYTRLDPYEVQVESGSIRSVGWLRKEDGPPGTGLRFDIHVGYPGALHLRFSPRLDAAVVCTPVDGEHTWIAARFHQRYVPVPGLGWLAARLAIAFEFQFIQPDDHRMVRSSLPRSGALSHGTLVRADRAIVAWHQLHRAALGDAPGTGAS
ncbi:C3: similar to Vanillate O-demethylase oxygenase [Myxococcus hansupus]|uniref:C3: similar to Vanillate O-demethylase oxygenase n=1 Tax=Pseudomyxococcus hansupus TaxID=1297742 RepID=A0A0H4WYZ9_9BACT|nr:aromatic ring-hydroxylating dioxygenase subunit alpha [Myxococcus hansupus]AKQ66575.1 C3: similar to Vanillate O-demethylase oxygenase [Myxococcus hansupus]